jgi:hypothetical protein
MTSLVLGILSVPTLGLLGLGALIAIVLGIVAIMKANRSPQEYGGKGLAIGGIVCGGASLVVALPLGAIVAAIAIPSLLRARMAANESGAVANVRTVIAAEATYQASTGSYGTLECLAKPAECNPKMPAIPLIDAALASGAPRNGYEFRLIPGAPAAGGQSAGGFESYAILAVPVKAGNTGIRAFCGDSTGAIRFTRFQGAPDAANGLCAESAELLL